MLVLLGETSSGKSTIEKGLVNLGYKKAVSCTTRKSRYGEKEGVDYYYISNERFNELINDLQFAEHSVYSGNRQYGLLKTEVVNDSIAVVTPHGLRQLKKNKDLNIVSFYITTNFKDRVLHYIERQPNFEIEDLAELYGRSERDIGMFIGIEDEVDFIIHNDYKTPIKAIVREILIKVCAQ